MKSVKLYVFKTDNINFANLLQFCFYLSRHDLDGPCVPVIQNKHLSLIPGNFCLFFEPEDPLNNFRNLDWNLKIQALNRYLADTDQAVAFGSNHIDQIDFIKHNIDHTCASISYSYDQAQYDQVLEYFVHSHLAKQASGRVPLTDLDQQLRQDQSIDLFEYYKTAFDTQNIIPRSMQFDTDHVIPLVDLLNKDKFFHHLVGIGGQRTAQADIYYNNWWTAQQDFFSGSNT